jgi:hypothetical protein
MDRLLQEIKDAKVTGQRTILQCKIFSQFDVIEIGDVQKILQRVFVCSAYMVSGFC